VRRLKHNLFTVLTLVVAIPLALITLVFAAVALMGMLLILAIGEQHSRIEQRKLGCPDE